MGTPVTRPGQALGASALKGTASRSGTASSAPRNRAHNHGLTDNDNVASVAIWGEEPDFPD